MPEYTTRETCRVCWSPLLVPLFSLGDQFVSNFISDPDQGGIKAPIDLVLCGRCSLVQLRHTAPQELLYTGHYWYRSGVTDTMKQALRDVSRKAEELVELKPDDVVLDIGSNDGTLLRSYESPVVRVGVEPANNLVEEGSKGVDVFIHDFWNSESYRKNVGKNAKVVTALGMFYDLEDPNRFINDIAEVLSEDGVFIAQLMCLKNMVDLKDVGNLAHEHLEFYSLKSLDYLLNKNGLEIFDLETNTVNGRSYRLFIRHIRGDVSPMPGSWGRLNRARESEQGLDDPNFYKQFYQDMVRNKNRLVSFIRDVVEKGKTVWIYGASTKGNVILQWADLYGYRDSQSGGIPLPSLPYPLIEAAADRSPEKWGRYTVGTGIKIVSEEEMRERKPDYLLCLPYAFKKEFLEREKEWRKQGGIFIFPLPEFHLV